jgi:hypothetical protein
MAKESIKWKITCFKIIGKMEIIYFKIRIFVSKNLYLKRREYICCIRIEFVK